MKKRFTEEQIIGFLREAEAGLPVAELCRRLTFGTLMICHQSAILRAARDMSQPMQIVMNSLASKEGFYCFTYPKYTNWRGRGIMDFLLALASSRLTLQSQ